jgi:hypothetical protein
VDEGLDVAKLQLYGRPDVVEPHDASVIVNDAQAALDVAEMIVGHFEDEQVFEDFETHDGCQFKI